MTKAQKEGLLAIAERLIRVSDKMRKRAVIDEHGKNNHVLCLECEGRNIQRILGELK